jgi:predicted dehydrogenase
MKVVLAGLGFMGRTHLEAISGLPEVELAGIVDPDEGKLALGVERYEDLDEALKDASVDAVDLCLPTDLHEAAAIAALRRGKHVLVEKPMAPNKAACARMIEAAREADRVLMVAHVLRFMPAYVALGSALKGETVRAASFRRRCAKPDWGEWFADEQRSGGGIFDLLIHDVDMALHLFGAPEEISATGFGNWISARFFYRDGKTIDISGGWLHDGFPFSMEYTVVTDRSTFDYDSGSGQVRCYPSGDLAVDQGDGYAAEIAYFAQCIKAGDQPVRCRPEESAMAVRLTLAMIGARAGNGEKIPWKSG